MYTKEVLSFIVPTSLFTSSLKLFSTLVTTPCTFIPMILEYSTMSVNVGMNITASAPGFAKTFTRRLRAVTLPSVITTFSGSIKA